MWPPFEGVLVYFELTKLELELIMRKLLRYRFGGVFNKLFKKIVGVNTSVFKKNYNNEG